MSAPGHQPSPDRNQITQLYPSSQYTETDRLKSVPSSTPLQKPSCTSSAHTEAGNECLDCLDPPNGLYMDCEPQSPRTALASSLSVMNLQTTTHGIRTTSSVLSTCSTESQQPISPNSSESPPYNSGAYSHENPSSILRCRNLSNSSDWSGPTEQPLPPSIPGPTEQPLPPLIPCIKPNLSFHLPSSPPLLEYRNITSNNVSTTRYAEDEKHFYENKNGEMPICPNNFGIGLNDTQLVLMDTKKINKLLKNKGLSKTPKERQLKQKRRTLKNRGYAAHCRNKREELSCDLANDNEDLEKQLNGIDAQIEEEQRQLKKVQNRYKKVFEWADNNPGIDVNKHLSTYKKLPF